MIDVVNMEAIRGAVARGYCHPENSNKVLDPELCEAIAQEVEAVISPLQEALIWCSGSDDFQTGGKARRGWLKLCAPLIGARPRRAKRQ